MQYVMIQDKFVPGCILCQPSTMKNRTNNAGAACDDRWRIADREVVKLQATLREMMSSSTEGVRTTPSIGVIQGEMPLLAPPITVVPGDASSGFRPFRISPAYLNHALKTGTLNHLRSSSTEFGRPARELIAASELTSVLTGLASEVIGGRPQEALAQFHPERLRKLIGRFDEVRRYAGLAPLFHLRTSTVSKEGTSTNLAKRAEIDHVAHKYDRSTNWADWSYKPPFAVGQKKCNQFIFDVTREAGAPGHIAGILPLAGEWANANVAIVNWRVLSRFEVPEGGDVAAFPVPGGGSAFTGHVGFIVSDGNGGITNISSHADGIYGKPGQFVNEKGLTFRRFTGA